MALGKILDYSQARPPLGKVKANGYAGVYRYVCSDASEAGLPGKRLTTIERDQILQAGLDIGLHGEDDAGAAQLGYTRGLAQGKQWADYASSVLGAPKGMTIVAAVDYDTLGVYPPVVADYLHGVKDGLAVEYAAGAYGSFWVVRGALASGVAVHAVQTTAWSSGYGPTKGCRTCDTPNWSAEFHTHVHRDAHLYQDATTASEFPGTDYNHVYHVPHGTWLQTLGDPVSATGPENWDDADYAALKKNLDALADYNPADPNNPSVATVTHVLLGVRDGAPGQNSLPWVVNQVKAALQASEKDIVTAISGVIAAGGDVNAVAQAVIDLMAARLVS